VKVITIDLQTAVVSDGKHWKQRPGLYLALSDITNGFVEAFGKVLLPTAAGVAKLAYAADLKVEFLQLMSGSKLFATD